MDAGTDDGLEEHTGATEEYADLLRQIKEELQKEESSHVDGSSHHWEVIINWRCSVCGGQQSSRPNDYKGSSKIVQRSTKNSPVVGTTGTAKGDTSRGKRLPFRSRRGHGTTQQG